jgi:ornithine cyclodeaminase/alanine dehydrogenase-like protein (mu-crystallin family)
LAAAIELDCGIGYLLTASRQSVAGPVAITLRGRPDETKVAGFGEAGHPAHHLGRAGKSQFTPIEIRVHSAVAREIRQLAEAGHKVL